jgi:hypothetical protein
MSNQSGLHDLKDLTPAKVADTDLPRFPKMTGWFHPLLLGKLLWRVILSDAFGEYADRRLMEAALDPAPKDEQVKRAQIGELPRDPEGAVWVDYVSDLGDGFDATYAIAWLLAQPELTVGGKTLPRGNVLVMGGDQVYPTAQRDDYKIRMLLPYAFALPGGGRANKLPVFLLPGNHDWYDGLVNFLAMFCREKGTRIGGWRTRQRRSYFAVRLTENWWIWGIDIALVRDMDQPQADYFVAIAQAMPEHANIILCSAEPGWYKAEAKGDSFRTLSYAAWIAENAGRDIKIPLILSGDSHHYARYAGAGAQYITSGGGGAFLHGTLELKDTITAEWLRERKAKLALECCYPSKATSRSLLGGNWRFGRLNPELPWALAALYLAFSFVLALAPPAPRWDVALAIYAVLFGGLYLYSSYQEGASRKIIGLSAAHAAAHMVVIAAISGLGLWVNERFLGGREWPWAMWLAGLAIVAFTVGRWLAGQIFGWSLLVGCRYFNIAHNDAFSAMKLDSHRHFLRMRILGDRLEIYPVKLEKVPTRSAWRVNPQRASDASASVFVADPPLAPELIEDAVVIDATRAPTPAEVKMPGDLPPAR